MFVLYLFQILLLSLWYRG